MALAANLLEALNGAEPQGTNQILDTDCRYRPMSEQIALLSLWSNLLVRHTKGGLG